MSEQPQKQSLTASDIIAAVKGPVDLLSKALLLTEQASVAKDLKIQVLEQALKEKEAAIKKQSDAFNDIVKNKDERHAKEIKSLEQQLDLKDKQLKECMESLTNKDIEIGSLSPTSEVVDTQTQIFKLQTQNEILRQEVSALRSQLENV